MTKDAVMVHPAHEIIAPVHISRALLLNSRRPGITYEYILRSEAGGRRVEHFLLSMAIMMGSRSNRGYGQIAGKKRKSLAYLWFATWLFADGCSNTGALVL